MAIGYEEKKERCQFMSYNQYQQGYQGFEAPQTGWVIFVSYQLLVEKLLMYTI